MTKTTDTTTTTTTTTSTQTQFQTPIQQNYRHHTPDRVIHKINLSALRHNYAVVESKANQQRCSVIVVVKGDGYGHGAIETALYLADHCGADAFAVATLEEAIALRQAFNGVSSPTATNGTTSGSTATHGNLNVNGMGMNMSRRNSTSNTTRIPIRNLFDGPTKASQSSGTATNTSTTATNITTTTFSSRDLRKISSNSSTISSITRTTTATKLPIYNERNGAIKRSNRIRILVLGPPVGYPQCFNLYYHFQIELMVSGPEIARALMEWVADEKERKRAEVEKAATEQKEIVLGNNFFTSHAGRNGVLKHGEVKNNPLEDDGKLQSATLTNVSGYALAKEVREILINQGSMDLPGASGKEMTPSTIVAKGSTAATPTSAVQRKRLRWHALVDSGMGRLGFKSTVEEEDEDEYNDKCNPIIDGDGIPNREKKNSKWKIGPHKDSVAIIKAMSDAEIYGGAPIEFYGMCTHMADANSSDPNYTNQQMVRFKSILKRVRQSGMSVPSISTDNSAALLSPKLSHFTPTSLLSQPQADTRGFVRTGGAIYGQRPAFPELKSISTLMASVRHVAVLQKDESVGYDRAYIAPRHTRIATLTIGFADGYPRELGNRKGQVCIRGAVFDVVGNVCMDMIMVDLGPAEEIDTVGSQVCVGDTAILWGPENEHDDGDGMVRLQDVANKLSTTQSALTCGLDINRVRRLYVE